MNKWHRDHESGLILPKGSKDSRRPMFTCGPAIYTPKDPYTVLLAHFDGTNGSAVMRDSSKYNHTLIPNAGTLLSSTQKKFGPTSVSLNGTSNYVTINNTTPLNFNNGDYTVEAWIYLTGYAQNNPGAGYTSSIIDKDGPGTNLREFLFEIVGTVSTWTTFALVNFKTDHINTDLILTAAFSFSLNTWYSVAATQAGNTVRLFINGNLVATGTRTTTGAITGAPILIGASGYTSNPQFFPGYIDEVRISKGIARYTASYTPAVGSFPA